MRKPRSTISRVGRTALAAATTSAVVMCSPPAHADDASDYAASYGGLVCKQLDATPTLPGVSRVGVLVAGEGFSSYDAGRILRLSVNTFCPRHTDLLQRYIAAAGVAPGRSA
ncbi:DUF732 domain-containing protein [Mycobacteroides abscessus]|uniref:DUF732 domain-containing protein n=1 Tax=Mycobacteroides abscessus TaxID=36809 RepID=UPI000929CA95|nr:DUF732 domain-containing protein [Mycobacteroides abscessus]MDO3335115.1 DUF732 domain-containing protein [Mycobacteroides abscessus subsp. bolletii]QSM87846.1 DUF732 domain-containing protein [Mycobacteroides abscessus subsp. bolletii]SIB00719.1 bacteriophage protein [Mycobacteroides abscessus subsp. bolletii]SII70306.1 Bacteriophage protein [Mycobacteroides abscessus subsp. bolletii]SKS57593.1 bacteriophage protein [Mycobacteroides abscessus subsp. bolletii]